MLLCLSARAMTIQEIAEATAVDMDAKSFSTSNRFSLPFDLLEFCSSLVSLSTVKSSTFYRSLPGTMQKFGPAVKDLTLVQFAHASVKEYLLGTCTSIPPRI